MSTLTSDEMVARVWDAYLHEFGIESYVIARYVSLKTMPINEDSSKGFPRAA